MMIVLTAADLARMSPELRADLQRFLFQPKHDVSYDAFDEIHHMGDAIQDVDDFPGWDPDDSSGAAPPMADKVVIDISAEQARDLLGNLAAKSIDTLRLFADAEAVGLTRLIGDGSPYPSFNDLKRSFVGAVNRRLRTVTGNRSAVLFRKTGDNELGGEEGIAVRPQTVFALKAAFQAMEGEAAQ